MLTAPSLCLITMSNYLGHLMRISAISTPEPVIPPIPWLDPVDRKMQQLVLWTQYTNVYMEKSSATSDLADPPLPNFDVYANVFGQYEYWDFKIKSQWLLGLLRNMADTLTLAPTDVLPYVSGTGYFTASIPAMVSKGSESVISTSGTYRLDGSNIYRVSTGSLYIGGAVVQRLPNFNAPPALSPDFTMNYNNPDPYTGGAFPPGTGNHDYYLHSTPIIAGQPYARYKPV